ncbi:MAG TPA: hydroxysqualene dehydroxylase HpnE [Micromonosporaceae bacterium]
MNDRVCVVGGGLAGISAALALVDAGHQVTVMEARPRLGGATYSFRRGERTVDTGQHVFLRCYTEYRALLDRLGTARHTAMQDRLTLPVLRPGARPVTLRRADLPAPLHLLPGLARYTLLSPTERLRAAAAAAALRDVDPDDPATDATAFGDWLAAHGQRGAAVARLWRLITVAALNIAPEHASMALAARVFRTGLLDRADAGDIGRPLVPLLDLHGMPAEALLTRLGVDVRTRTRAVAVEPDGGGDSGGYRVVTGDGVLSVDAVVLAVPHPAAARLVPLAAAPDRDQWRRLGESPIVNVHVVYDRTVTDLAFAAAVDTPAQWVFDGAGEAPGDGQYLVLPLSAADDLISRPAGELAEVFTAALADLFPTARRAQILDVFVTREPRATFRQAPGTRRYRPPAATRLPGLALAGAWTDTGWPDTMEGAVRSGRQAADVVRAHLGSRHAEREAIP